MLNIIVLKKKLSKIRPLGKEHPKNHTFKNISAKNNQTLKSRVTHQQYISRQNNQAKFTI